MHYFIIAGEASGDLHAAALMREIKARDPEANFCFVGGDHMTAQGGTRLRHYKDIAYMGFLPVLLHLRTILGAMKLCKRVIARWRPNVVILVDYPGFNLSIAKFVKARLGIPVFYYISPKIWAWKEYRIKQIRRDVSELFSILPFEVPFFEQKHRYPIHYVGNPSVDEIAEFRATHHESLHGFCQRHQLQQRPIIALLPGSRVQEVRGNLATMVQAAWPLMAKGYQIVVARVGTLDMKVYEDALHLVSVNSWSRYFNMVENDTMALFSVAEAAVVTSGTATLETAIFRVPQVVCYNHKLGRVVRIAKRLFLHVKYISLVNLIADAEVVPELIADQMNVANVRQHLLQIIHRGRQRQAQLDGYDEMLRRLGPTGAPQRAAEMMTRFLVHSER